MLSVNSRTGFAQISMNTVRIPIDSAELDGELIIPPAAEMGNQFAVVVSHGGRPDLAGAID